MNDDDKMITMHISLLRDGNFSLAYSNCDSVPTKLLGTLMLGMLATAAKNFSEIPDEKPKGMK